jgi:murein DD-endopeptidase MepM/ murein hydrolase activator NlpD
MLIEEHDYYAGIEFYKKALNTAHNEDIRYKLDNTLEELKHPKILIGNTPLICGIYMNNVYTSASFNRLPVYSDISIPVQYHKYAQGSILRIKMIVPQELSHFTVMISNDDEKYTGTAFKIKNNSWHAFIGLGSIIKTGIYNFSGEGLYLSGDSLKIESKIEIVKRDFPEEVIYFNDVLTALLTKPTPEQTAERRYLRTLINTINPGSIYETGNFILPLSGYPKSTTFGDRCRYIFSDGSDYFSVHRGIDFAAPPGCPVESMGSGKVVLAVYRILTGNTAVIEHLPGVYSIYYHMSEITVREDETVGAGDIIGKVGSTGLSTGPHLHLALYVSGEYVDPEFFVLNKPLE